MRKVIQLNKKTLLTTIAIEVLLVILCSCLMVNTAHAINKKPVIIKMDDLLNVSWVDIPMISAPVIIKTRTTDEISKIEEAKREAAKKTEEKKKQTEFVAVSYSGSQLTRMKGTVQGPSGKETYYNLNMSGVVSIMRRKGFSEAEYPYHVRSDGVKCLGPYVMVAAHLGNHPRGSTVQTSLGTGLVCDTGGFAASNPNQLDIATNW